MTERFGTVADADTRTLGRPNCSGIGPRVCISVGLPAGCARSAGYSPARIFAALHKLEAAADTTGITPCQANLHTYQCLRYGVDVQARRARQGRSRDRSRAIMDLA